MANKPSKRKVPASGSKSGAATSTGRTTPKGSGSKGSGSKGSGSKGSGDSRRYTPPVPKETKVSPRWVGVLMFGLLGLGLLVIIVNYFGGLPGGDSNWYLVLGLSFILGGIITGTQWH